MSEKLTKFKALVKILVESDCLKEIKNAPIDQEIETPTLDEYNDLLDSVSEEEGIKIVHNLDDKTRLKLEKEMLLKTPYIEDLSDDCIKGLILFGQLELLEYDFEIHYDVFNKTIYTFVFTAALTLPIKDYTFEGKFNMSKTLYNKLINNFINNGVCFTLDTDDMSEEDKYSESRQYFQEHLNMLVNSNTLDTSDIQFDASPLPEGITQETMDKINDFLENVMDIMDKKLKHKEEDNDEEEENDYE